MQLLHTLHRIGQAAGKFYTQAPAPTETSITQVLVLNAIARRPGQSQTNVVDFTGVDRSTLAQVIGRLQRRGLVKRSRSKQDGRAYVLELTERGRAELKTAHRAAQYTETRLLSLHPALRNLTLDAA